MDVVPEWVVACAEDAKVENNLDVQPSCAYRFENGWIVWFGEIEDPPIPQSRDAVAVYDDGSYEILYIPSEKAFGIFDTLDETELSIPIKHAN